MSTSFPTALDNLLNPASTDAMDTPTLYHDFEHANANDAIEALQAKVGIDSSAVTSSLDYLVKKVNVRQSPSDSAIPLTIKAFSTSIGAGSLLSLQDPSGNKLVDVDTIGRTRINPSNASSLGFGTIDAGAIINPRTAGAYGLVVVGLASQTQNPLEVRNSASTPMFSVGPSGQTTIAPTVTSVVGLVVSGPSSPASHLARFDPSGSAAYLAVDKDANLVPEANNNLAIGTASLAFAEMNAVFMKAQAGIQVGGSSTSWIGTSSAATGIGLTIQHVTGVGVAARLQNAQLSVSPSNAAYEALVVQGIASQTADLTQWRNSAGTLLGSFTAAGAFSAASVAASSTGATAGARFMGGTTSGAPTSGSFLAGDYVIDQTGQMWICYVSGSPGTWAVAGTGVELAYAAASTPDQTFTSSTAADVSGASITFTVGSRPVYVHAWCCLMTNDSTATSNLRGMVMITTDESNVEKTRNIGFNDGGVNGAVANHGFSPQTWERFSTPGTYTRKIRASRSASGVGTVTVYTTLAPTFIRAITA